MRKQVVSLVSAFAAAMLIQACSPEPVGPGDPDVRHAVESAADAREPLRLGGHERDLVLAEMRLMLESTEGVVVGLASNDSAAIEQAAARSGRRAPGTIDQELHGALPEDFLRMGEEAHGGFDEIAQMARDGASSEAMTARLGATLHACTSCHATYRVEVTE